ncbi:MAG: CapA family protein [Tissierellales bacterium]|nr:CapA family protein [Tissierellales bacterium]MBN2827087.1 CapA family protein [Tissierellales bacterium]
MKRKKKKGILVPVILLIGMIGLLIFTAYNISSDPDDNPPPSFSQPEPSSSMTEDPEKPRNETIVLSAVGDIIYHMSQITSAYDEQKGTYDFNRYFDEIKPIIEAADIAVANFEGTTAGDDIYAYKAYPIFNAPDETLDAIKYAGFDVISTVNNHSIDTNKIGIERTLQKIQDRGMMTVGTYAQKPETRILIVEEKDIRVAFMAYTYGCNGMEAVLTPEELDAMVNIIDEDKINEDIADAKAQNADLIVAFMHWGNEYQRDPSQDQKDLANSMIEKGVDIILGSHPHVIQDSVTLEHEGETKFVIYSMGNFISNQRQESLDPEYPNLKNYYTEDGVIVNIKITKSFEDNQTVIEDVSFIPTWVYRVKAPPLFDYKVIPLTTYPANNPLGLDEVTLGRMERSYNDTMIKMNTNR